MPSTREILDIAEGIHRREGLDSLSVRRVAEEVGVTPMALYRHFPGKDGLLDALVARGFAKLESRFGRAARKRTPLARVRGVLTEYREFAIAEPRVFELMFFVRRRNVPTAPASLAQSSSPAFTIIIASVAAAMEEGRIRTGDPAQTILLLWSVAHGLIALHFSGRFGGDASRFRRIYDAQIATALELLAG
ncbi:MAG TPA: TetR/AcrR family transcriptional regulator [Gemmatimonadaceae bacterium]|nr:TetR/AcrR family transcriptional regulator [Gemmatimonadaceae bacterium]